MARVTNLLKYRADKKNSGHLAGIKHVMVIGARLCVKLLTTGDLPLDWLKSLRWKVTHCQTGRSATIGGDQHSPIIEELYRDEEGIAIEIKPVFPSLGRIEMNEQLCIDIWTEAGHLHFLNKPSVPDELLEPKPKSSSNRRGHLKLVQG